MCALKVKLIALILKGYHILRGLVNLKKGNKSEKNSKVGGWIKPQLGFFCVWPIQFFLGFILFYQLDKTPKTIPALKWENIYNGPRPIP